MINAAQVKQYLKEVRTETRKVTFPTKQDTVTTTWVVIIVVIIIGFYLGLLDVILSFFVGMAMS